MILETRVVGVVIGCTMCNLVVHEETDDVTLFFFKDFSFGDTIAVHRSRTLEPPQFIPGVEWERAPTSARGDCFTVFTALNVEDKFELGDRLFLSIIVPDVCCGMDMRGVKSE